MFCEEGESVRKPGVVRWVETLQDPDCPLEHKQLIRFAINGMKYGDKDFFVNDSFSDSLTFQLSLLGKMKKKWREMVTKEIGRCEQAAQCVGRLAWELSLRREIRTIRPRNPPAPSSTLPSTSRSGFGCKALIPNGQADEKPNEWQEKARKLAAELGRQMVERAGNAAFVGHRVEVKTGGKKDEKKTVLYTAPKAYNSFLYNLRKLYPKKEGGTA